MANTKVVTGKVRFSYCNIFEPREPQGGGEAKYSVTLLIPKSDAQAKQLIDAAVEAAKKNGVSTKWNGKMPAASKLTLPLRDGDEEFPDDPNYRGMWFMNANTGLERKPGVRVLEHGQLAEALDNDDFYSGCYGCATVGMYPYNVSGNMGVACGLNNVVKTRDGERLAGGKSAEEDFGDLVGDSMACLD